MVQKIITILVKSNSCAGFLIELFHLAEFLNRVWSPIESVFVVLVGLWVPLIRLATFLFHTFGVRLPLWLPAKRSKLILLTAYWFGVSAVCYNIFRKWAGNYDRDKLFALAAIYLFFIIMDYIETRNVIDKIDKK